MTSSNLYSFWSGFWSLELPWDRTLITSLACTTVGKGLTNEGLKNQDGQLTTHLISIDFISVSLASLRGLPLKDAIPSRSPASLRPSDSPASSTVGAYSDLLGSSCLYFAGCWFSLLPGALKFLRSENEEWKLSCGLFEIPSLKAGVKKSSWEVPLLTEKRVISLIKSVAAQNEERMIFKQIGCSLKKGENDFWTNR